MDDKNELVSVAMQIILHAGNARNEAADALEAAKKFDFEQAELLLSEAEQSILAAHKAQTKVIQCEASGHAYPPSLLFAHAQDTLMTINSEFRMSKQLIDVLEIVHHSIKEDSLKLN